MNQVVETKTVIPGYELLNVLGRGGTGRVYKARDLKLGRTVAIKLLIDFDDPEQVARFEEEARVVANLTHPNIVRLFEFGKPADDAPYCVMEYASGGSLADVLRGNPIHWQLAANTVRTLARALQAAHSAGILHRDIKPGNVLIADEEDTPSEVTPGSDPFSQTSLRISDFGLARRIQAPHHLTRTGQMLGTPGYTAPEQISGMNSNPGPGADIYSLGCVLFELITGRPPFMSADPFDVMIRSMSDDPPTPRSLQPSIPADLQTICLKCLAKSPSRRYLTAGDLADDLERLLAGRPILARPVSKYEKLAKWVSRNPWKSAVLGLLVVLTTGSIAGMLALQSAYAATLAANDKLTLAVQESDQSFRLTQDALDRVVNRVRNDLYEVPQATGLMHQTAIESAELNRKLYEMRPHDLRAAHNLIDAFEQLATAEWVFGDVGKSVRVTEELESLLNNLVTQHNNDERIDVARAKLLLEKVQFPADGMTLEQKQQIETEVTAAFQHLEDVHPESLLVGPLRIQEAQYQMNKLSPAKDGDAFFREGKRRLDLAIRNFELQPLAARSEATSWVIMACIALADGYSATGQYEQAAEYFQRGIQQLDLSPEIGAERNHQQQRATMLAGLGLAVAHTGSTVEGSATVQQGLSLIRKLIEQFPEDQEYLRTQLTVLLTLAEIDQLSGTESPPERTASAILEGLNGLEAAGYPPQLLVKLRTRVGQLPSEQAKDKE
ncbi:MAG: serine/threonine protein kinase [Planctomyces sp.]|nr:serine/threonine protein kinase [Planctomyces sp.]